MNFSFLNFTPFPALNFQMMDVADAVFHVMVLRATLDIAPDGSLLFADEQASLVMKDEHFPAPFKSVRQESDLAPYKPLCDVIVNTRAYSPNGKPASEIMAGLIISDSSGKRIRVKFLNVYGWRFWGLSLIGWSLEKPHPVTFMPIRYEYAYGGDNRVEPGDPGADKIKEEFRLTPEQRQAHPDGPEKAPIFHAVWPENPVGCGYAEKLYLKGKRLWKVPAPLIEGIKNPVTKFRAPYPVEGLGVIGRTWRPRLDLAGTFDNEWLEDRDCLLPDDFDFAYYNCAHPDLQVPYLKGDEEIALYNLCPPVAPGSVEDEYGNNVLTIKLPGQTVRLTLESESGKFDVVNMPIDTLIIEPDERRVYMVWRKLLPFGEGIGVARAEVKPLTGESTIKLF